MLTVKCYIIGAKSVKQNEIHYIKSYFSPLNTLICKNLFVFLQIISP